MRFDASQGECLIFTEKEGVLSPLAHDLILRVSKFHCSIDVNIPEIECRFDAHSLQVIDACRKRVAVPGVLSTEQKREIEETIRKKVLCSKRYPEIRFCSNAIERDGEGFQIAGRLSLHGQTRGVKAKSYASKGMQVVETVISQKDFGITPFRAMMGTLRVHPDVFVRFTLPMGDQRFFE